MRNIILFIFLFLGVGTANAEANPGIIVYQSDFGLKDGAVSAMHGVAMQEDDSLKIFDLTHEIPAYNTWEASYRLFQTIEYWPAGTVFVSVVDPGVGTERPSVVLKTQSGHYVVTPDNGTLTLVAEHLGIAEIREIDEVKNRRADSGKSYTFHGRDVYSYTAARLASNTIQFNEVGRQLPDEVMMLDYQQATQDGTTLKGNIPILDVQYGNIWSNIPADLFTNYQHGDQFSVKIFNKDMLVYSDTIPYAATFGDVDDGKPLVYLNSLMNVSIALNMDDFAATYGVGSGADWSIELTPAQ